MDLSSYLLYVSVSVVASVSVGPSVILAANNSLNFGRRKALKGVLGHISAIMILAIVSASGVGAVLLASEISFFIIKYLGVAYLIYIGISIFKNKGSWSFDINRTDIPTGVSLYRKGLILGLSNPKALIFFTALFPQFITHDAPLIPQFLILAGTSLVNGFIFTFGYALLAHRFKDRILPIINNGWLSRVTGTLFVGFAAALALGR